MSQQTAVEWFNQQLINRQNGNGDSSWDEIYEQAKQMECKEYKKIYDHAFNYGSEFSQTEISDEQIYNKAEFHDGSDYSIGQHHGFIEGAKWAINKLKNK